MQTLIHNYTQHSVMLQGCDEQLKRLSAVCTWVSDEERKTNAISNRLKYNAAQTAAEAEPQAEIISQLFTCRTSLLDSNDQETRILNLSGFL